jgi:signal transduction histidine kinase
VVALGALLTESLDGCQESIGNGIVTLPSAARGLQDRLRLSRIDLDDAVAEAKKAIADRETPLQGAGAEPANTLALVRDTLSRTLLERAQTQAELARTTARLRWLEALQETSPDMAATLDGILDEYVSALRKGLGVAPALCCVVDASARYLHARTWQTATDATKKLIIDLDGPEQEAHRALRQLGLGKEREDWAGAKTLDVSGRSGLLVIPMLAGARSVGQLVVEAAGNVKPVGTEVMADLMAFAAMCGSAVARHHAQQHAADLAERLSMSLRAVCCAANKGQTAPEALTQFAERFAQALQRPMGLIATHSQRLLCRSVDPADSHQLETIVRECRQVGRILSDLLVFGQRSEPKLEPSLVNLLLRQLILSVQKRLERKSIRITELYAEGLPRIMVDRAQMERVFLNLIHNAEQAMADHGGTLTVQTGPSADRKSVIIRFTDTGPGIPAQDLEKVFEPFYTTGKGTVGLGLAVCRSIVQGHAGGIEVASTPGQGSTFIMALPTTGGTKAMAPPSAGDTEPTGVPAELLKVLVVDDDEGVREILKRTLQMRGYVVETASDGLQAMAALATNGVDLVLLDICMPGRDGLSVLSELQERGPGPPVIVMTGSTSPEDIEEAIRRGARTCLQKPFELRQLLAEVDGLVAEHRQ